QFFFQLSQLLLFGCLAGNAFTREGLLGLFFIFRSPSVDKTRVNTQFFGQLADIIPLVTLFDYVQFNFFAVGSSFTHNSYWSSIAATIYGLTGGPTRCSKFRCNWTLTVSSNRTYSY